MDKVKFCFLIFLFLLSTGKAYSQGRIYDEKDGLDFLSYNYFQKIRKYSDEQKIDSANLEIKEWEAKIGKCEIITRMKILLAIQNHKFSEAVYDSTIIGYVYIYKTRRWNNTLYVAFKKSEEKSGYCMWYEEYNQFTMKLAKQLKPLQAKNSLESLFCRFYGDFIKNPFDEIGNSKFHANTNIRTYYNRAVEMIKSASLFHVSVMFGSLFPVGKLSLTGNHISFGIQAGVIHKKMTYNFDLTFRGLDSPKPFVFLDDNKMDTTTHYSGGYIGLDIDREIYKTKHSQFDISGGVGYDVFKPSSMKKVEDTNRNDIGSINLNIGCGYKYFFKPDFYIGLVGKYNYVNYKNKGTTDLSGNFFTLCFVVGINTWEGKRMAFNELRYNYSKYE